MIASVFLFYNKLSQPIVGLAIGVLVGGLAQLLFQLPALIKRGAKYFLTFDCQNPGVRRVGALMVPAAIGLSATQINTVVDRMLGSLLTEGSISALYYGNRLIQLPLAIFGIAIATAVFPQLARKAQAKRMDEMKEVLRSSLKLVFFTTLPASVGLIVLGEPIIRLLFERREFTSGDTSATAFALLFYAVGLFAYASIVVIVRTFYSFQDTRTPVKIGCIAMVANIILNLILMRPLAQGGLAFATALAAMINMSLLLWVLHRRIGPLGGANVIGAFGRLLGVSAIMGIVCWLVTHALESFATSLGFQVLQVGTGIIVGVATFGLISYLLKIEEIRTVLQLVTKRR
jgi:putative peptidoglycan lipid II flippase